MKHVVAQLFSVVEMFLYELCVLICDDSVCSKLHPGHNTLPLCKHMKSSFVLYTLQEPRWSFSHKRTLSDLIFTRREFADS